MMLTLTDNLRIAYPDAFIGMLVMRGARNPESCPALDEAKARLEEELRARYGAGDRTGIKAHPTIAAYNAYYKTFKKTYHVQQQLESVAIKGRDIPRAAALVEAMFMAELSTLLLTAGHDLDIVVPPVRADVANGTEAYMRINGEAQALKEGDMFIADAVGVMSAIIYGPDRRTMITPETENVLFTIYAPPGIPRSLVGEHLAIIRDNILIITPDATVELLEVLPA